MRQEATFADLSVSQRAPPAQNCDGDTIGGMASPSPVLVRVDQQGRLVLPLPLRAGFVDTPGELLLQRIPEGLLLTPATGQGSLRVAKDGLPVLELGRAVTNAEVVAAIDDERRGR